MTGSLVVCLPSKERFQMTPWWSNERGRVHPIEMEVNGMKRHSLIWLILLLACLPTGLAFLTSGCGPAAQPEAQAAEGEATPLPEASVVPIEVTTVQTGPIALVFANSGDLETKDTVSIMPGAAGRIESVLVEVGDKVKAGDALAIIEQDTYAARLKQAEAALDTARLNLAKMEEGSRDEQITAAQAVFENAKANLNDVALIDDEERTRSAAALASTQAALRRAQAEYDKIAWAGQVGEMPQAIALEQATIAYESALANYTLDTNPGDSRLAPLKTQLAQAQLNLALTLKPFREVDFSIARTAIRQAEAAVDLAQLQLKETTIEAPFDGVVAELYVTEGDTVGLQAPVAMFVSQEVEVLVNVEENRIVQISKNQHASLRVAAYPGQDFPAVVTSIAPVADKETHTFAIKVTPLDEAGLLRSGMYADVSILAQEKQSTLLIPQTAVVLVNARESVYVVIDDIVELRPVATGLADGNYIEILSGLKPGDIVVVAGQPNLVDGARVEVTSGS
jgi:multidrug efflux pump subunit AcrA (membrane-fusion protein)